MRGSRIAGPLLALLLGCGRIGFERDTDPDAIAACVVHDTVDSCGAACVTCPAGDDRQQPTCNGTSCGLACAQAAPRCSDQSCARFAWTFDSGTLEGITPAEPADLVLAVREHAGNPALAIDVTNGGGIEITVPICLSGDVALQARTLTATVFYEGVGETGPQYYLQSAMPRPMTGAYLSTIDLGVGSYVTYSAPINLSRFAATGTTVVLQTGSLGAAFAGTIWFDDIKIQ